MKNERFRLPGNTAIDLRWQIPSGAKTVFVLSSGYGEDQFEEVAQLALVDLLSLKGIGWVQYIYPERCEANSFTDLYISTGVTSLTWVYDWAASQQGVENICLYGYSFGANISMEVALIRSVNGLILLNPVFDYVEYRTKQLGSDSMEHWQRSRVIELTYGGRPYPLGYRFLLEAEQQNLIERAAGIRCPVFAFQAEGDAILRTEVLNRMAQSHASWRSFLVPGDTADHNFEHPAAVRYFVEQTDQIIESLARDR